MTPAQRTELAQSAQIIYEGFKFAVAAGISKEKAGILVDEHFGADMLRDASANGFVTACPLRPGGLEQFDYHPGPDFANHIEAVQPTFCKTLVRYNPEGDFYANRRQLIQLRKLSQYLQSHSQIRFLLELLVPPEKAQLDRCKGDKQAYDSKLRPKLVWLAIHQFQNCGIEPDVWAIEGFQKPEEYERIIEATQRDGRDQVGCIVSGDGADEDQVCEWLMAAAGVKGFIGFALGRAILGETLANLKAEGIGRERAVWEIARSFQWFADIYEQFSPIEKTRGQKRRHPLRHYWDRWLVRKAVSPLPDRIIRSGH